MTMPNSKPLFPLRRGLLALCAAATLLAGCGGSSQIEPFKPTHLYVFGDELSLLNAEGRRWGVNGLDATTSALDCKLNPIWVQQVASVFGMVLRECNPADANGKVATPTADIDAALGAGIAELEAQVKGRLAAMGDTTLVTLLVGTHDIIALAQQVAAGTALATAQAEARARGERAAAQVRAMAERGAKVVVITPPAVELTPWAVSRGTTVRDQVFAITEAYSAGMRSRVGQLDGRQVAMLVGTDTTRLMVLAPANFGLTNSTAALETAACKTTAVLPNCSANGTVLTDLVDGATATNYLWADELRPGPVLHSQFGSRVLSLVNYF